MKVCGTCEELKSIDLYHIDRTKKDGRASMCKACKSSYFRKYYAANKDSICERASAYQKSNPDVQRKAKLKWQANNKEAHLAARRRWHSRKYGSDIQYRLNFIVRGALRRTMDAARRNGKRLSTEALGYTPEMLRLRLEMNFKPGMSWGNYGEWHVDHRVPVARLVRRGVTSPAQINCLANLVPLWAEENMRKGKR